MGTRSSWTHCDSGGGMWNPTAHLDNSLVVACKVSLTHAPGSGSRTPGHLPQTRRSPGASSAPTSTAQGRHPCSQQQAGRTCVGALTQPRGSSSGKEVLISVDESQTHHCPPKEPDTKSASCVAPLPSLGFQNTAHLEGDGRVGWEHGPRGLRTRWGVEKGCVC